MTATYKTVIEVVPFQKYIKTITNMYHLGLCSIKEQRSTFFKMPTYNLMYMYLYVARNGTNNCICLDYLFCF